MNRTIRTLDEYNTAMGLLKETSMSEVARLTGIPWSTIKNWKNGRSRCYQAKFGEVSEWKKNTISQKIRDSSISDFQGILDNSSNISEILRTYGVEYSKPYYVNLIKDKMNSGLYDLSKYDINSANPRQHGQWSLDEVFTKDSKINRSIVRNKIIRNNLMEYKCTECPITAEYNNKPITLQLDHINGIRNDHRLENLRWLCPNCHSQQETSFGKNKKR